MKPYIAIQIVIRAILWIFIFSYEIIGKEIIIHAPLTYLHYVVAIAITTVLFILTFRLGENELVWDIRELCFYDIVVHCVGLALHFFWYCLPLYITLCNAIFMLKFARLLWPAKNDDGSALTGWPVFGPVGYLRMRMNTAHTFASSKQNKMVYACIMASFPLAYLIHLYGLKMDLPFWATVVLCIIVLGCKRFMIYLANQHAQYMANENAAAVAAVTAIKNAELEAKNIELAAKSAELETKNITMLNAAHDLKQPLLKIQAQALDVMAAKDDDERAALAKPFFQSIAQFGADIDNTIYNAKITTKLAQPHIVAISAVQFQHDLYGELEHLADANEIDFDVRSSSNGKNDFSIATDEDILLRILSNLVGNAINNSSQGGKVRVTLRRRGNMCEIAVWDKGSGIEDASGPDGAANFTAFAQRIKERNRTAQKGTGHGLGVNNVKQLCAAIGVTMMLRSKVGIGSVFYFNVPFADATHPKAIDLNDYA